MIIYCPYCGNLLKHPVECGITTCNNCNRVFDTSPFNKMLSASWLVRKRQISIEEVVMHYGYTQEEASMVIEAVFYNCYSHEDFVEFLKEKGISKNYQVD